MPADPRARSRIGQVTGTVRFRVTALAVVAVAGVLLATGIGLVTAQRQLLTENVEETIRQRADDLATLVTTGQVPLALTQTEGTLEQIVTPDGRVLAASPTILTAPPLGPSPPGDRTEILRTVEHLPTDAAPFRLLTRRVRGRDGTVVLHVASALDDVEDSARVLAATLTVAIPAVTAILAALVWRLVGRTLRPVEAIRAEVAHMTGTDLCRRVPQPDGDDEIARLARTMNAMLDRVEDASDRQQRFVADASHELRNPLTRIRSALEVDLAHPDTADRAVTHRGLLDETIALQRLVEDLLHLARSDAGAHTARREPVDLDDIVFRDATRLRADGRVAVDVAAVSGAQVRGDPDQLARAVRNLTDNAARHARTMVTIALTEHEQAAVLSVADDGPGIPADQRQSVFERFVRLDDARTAATGGAGLGLAIARDIVRRHHGTISIDPDHHPGSRFIVTLPIAP
ncbi:MAG TPA: HAMP domain-containing sensor histidine kinase [Actinomycetes bacterium]|nr:HAMP domain-containing sensor histidine kinase [Actinomycetes bacterium]